MIGRPSNICPPYKLAWIEPVELSSFKHSSSATNSTSAHFLSVTSLSISLYPPLVASYRHHMSSSSHSEWQDISDVETDVERSLKVDPPRSKPTPLLRLSDALARLQSHSHTPSVSGTSRERKTRKLISSLVSSTSGSQRASTSSLGETSTSALSLARSETNRGLRHVATGSDSSSLTARSRLNKGKGKSNEPKTSVSYS